MVVEVFALETDKLAVTTEFGKVAFPAVNEVAGAETEVTGAGLSMRSATCWIVTVDWLLRDNRGRDIKTMDKGQLNCDDKPGESLDCVPLYTLLIGCSDRLSYCVPRAPLVLLGNRTLHRLF